jgi:aarF domain-containing kinase
MDTVAVDSLPSVGAPRRGNLLDGIANGWTGLTRAVTFWGTILPAVQQYQKLNRWKDTLDENDAEAQAEAKRQAEKLHDKFAPRVLELCIKLRGVYLKLGQVCSILPAIPLAYRRELKVLQDGVPPRSAAEVHKILEDALGQPATALFASFEEEPVGSASVGQVHRATLHDGRQVAVKVQYPDVAGFFASDMQQMINAVRMLESSESVDTAKQLSEVLMAELDFRREAAVMDRVAKSMASGAFARKVAVPRPIPGMVTPNVLVMTWLEGERLLSALERLAASAASRLGVTKEEFAHQLGASMDAGAKADAPASSSHHAGGQGAAAPAAAAAAAGATTAPPPLPFAGQPLQPSFWFKLRAVLALLRAPRALPALWRMRRCFRLLVDVLAHQILVDGCFSTDPHPGNLLLCPDGRLGLLDFGQHGTLSLHQRRWFCRTVVAVASGDEAAMARQARELGMHTRHDRDSTLAFHIGTPWSGNLGTKMKHLRTLRKEDPVLARGEAALLLPFRPIAIIMAMCRTFGVHVHMARAFLPVAFACNVLRAESAAAGPSWKKAMPPPASSNGLARCSSSSSSSSLLNWRLWTTWAVVFLAALAAQVAVIRSS